MWSPARATAATEQATAIRGELTDALIRTLRAPAGQRLEIWDASCEGLVLRVSDKGRVTFHARARGPDGRKRFAGLGMLPALSLSDARREARISIGGMQKGLDPTAEKQAARAARIRDAAMPTLRELGQAWAKAHERDTSARYRAELLATVNRRCGSRPHAGESGTTRVAELLARRIDCITTEDIAAVVQGARARGDGEARHLVRALRRLFGFAIAIGHVGVSPVEDWARREKGGRRSIPWMRDGIRERVLSDSEMTKIWLASDALDPTARAFTRLTILTAARVGEIAGLGWRELTRERSEEGREIWTAMMLPPTRTKNRRGHRVPLGRLASVELEALAAPDGGAVLWRDWCFLVSPAEQRQPVVR